jgi:hypothetical protein
MMGLVIGLLCVAVIGWMLFMATFRTGDFINLMKADEERRKNSGARLGKAVKGAVGIARMFTKH